ncbi:MAG TPA: hypothetical protein PLZ45_02150 [Ferruginibacter sp.]|nr:hypothetical protein [Chitinophagaceae bacterium]HRI23443.1 hypothetical protein [Ferruginibacter sp.]
MKHTTLILSLLLLGITIPARSFFLNTAFDKTAFYNAMASEKVDDINSQLSIVKALAVAGKDAYEGALLMRKAGLVSKAKEKLSLFKEGRKKLEASISKDNDNVEYCFLRLIIQEHAPKAVEYRNNIEHDSKLILSNYKNLPAAIQQAIIDYSKKSKSLKGLLP